MEVNFAEVVDLGGASCAAMVWRAAAAIELGIANVVVIAAPSWPSPRPPTPAAEPSGWRFGASSANYGSPQAEFDIPYGNVAQNCGYAQIAMRYGAEYGYDPEALAKIAVDQRISANHNPPAVFHDVPITIEDVLNSPMISDPAAHAGDRDALLGRRGAGRREQGVRAARTQPARSGSPASASGCCTRRRPTRKTCCRRRSPRSPIRPSRCRAGLARMSTCSTSTTATRSRC